MPPKYEQHYREEWEKMSEFKDWLTGAKDDTAKAYCKYCKCTIIAKKYCLKQHILTSKHMKYAAPMKCQSKIEFPRMQIQLDTQRAESSLALFVCEHTSTLTVDHLSQMCKKHFLIADIKLHRTKCTNIIKYALAPHFTSQLVTDVGNNKFSILVDESTDISVTKILGTSIRYYSSSHKKIVTTFLGLVEIENGTANAIVEPKDPMY